MSASLPSGRLYVVSVVRVCIMSVQYECLPPLRPAVCSECSESV
jgi:hypothetical protein